MKNSDIDFDVFANQVVMIAEEMICEQYLSSSEGLLNKKKKLYTEDDLKQAQEIAKNVISQNKVKNVICKALKSAKEDIRDFSKIIAAALLTFALSKDILIPITPIVFATISVMVFNIGVSTFCDCCQ